MKAAFVLVECDLRKVGQDRPQRVAGARATEALHALQALEPGT